MAQLMQQMQGAQQGGPQQGMPQQGMPQQGMPQQGMPQQGEFAGLLQSIMQQQGRGPQAQNGQIASKPGLQSYADRMKRSQPRQQSLANQRAQGGGGNLFSGGGRR